MAAGAAAVAGVAAREARSQGKGLAHRRAPLLRPRLFRIPAFAAGLSVLLAFGAGMQGFSSAPSSLAG